MDIKREECGKSERAWGGYKLTPYNSPLTSGGKVLYSTILFSCYDFVQVNLATTGRLPPHP